MRFPTLIFPVLLIPAALALAVPVLAADQAGVSAAVKGQVALNRPQTAVGHQVVGGEPIFLQDAIQSGPRSGMQIMLLDETVFTIGPESEMVVDEFVYDPQTNTGKVSAKITKGVFRFVTGRVARENPADMNVKLPSGTLGVRGTIVAGRVDAVKQSSLLVLLGEGPENDTGSRASALEGCNADVCKQVRRPGYGLTIDGPGFPPSEPFLVPLAEIDRLTQSVSDPAGYVETATSSGGGGTDVASEESSAVDGDTRSATEVSGRADASGMALAERAERRGGALDRLDEATTNAQQDQNEGAIVPLVVPLATLALGPDLATVVPPAPQPPGFDFLGLPGFSGLSGITSFADVDVLAATPGGQTATYQQSGVRLDDTGSYNFSLYVDFAERVAELKVSNIYSPSLSLDGEGFKGWSGLGDPKVGVPFPFAFISDRITTGGSGPCRSGCDAVAAALLLNGSRGTPLADSAIHLVEITAPPPPATPSNPNPSGITVMTHPESMLIPRNNP